MTVRLYQAMRLFVVLFLLDTAVLAFQPHGSRAQGGGHVLAQQQRHMLSSRDVLSSLSLPDKSTIATPLHASLSSSSSSLPGNHNPSSSSLPKRKRKKRQHNKRGGPLTEQDVAEHVSALYIHGPGGVLRETTLRRQRRQAELLQKRTTKSTATTKATSPTPNDNDDDEEDYLRDEQAQLATLRNLDRHPALLLNADYQPMSWLPLSLWNWQEAVKAIFSGKVTVVDVYPDVTIRAANLEVPLPSVIALTEYVPLHQQTPAFTKRNVFLRDEYRCQYCNEYFHTRDLSLDHVVPRCKGGRLHWTNAVTCCRRCNGRKGSLDVKEIRRLGMRLLREPRTPTQYELAATASRMLPRRVHPTWEPYLGIQPQPQQGGGTKTKKNKNKASSEPQQHQHAAAMEEEL